MTRTPVGTSIDPRDRKVGNEPVENWGARLFAFSRSSLRRLMTTDFRFSSATWTPRMKRCGSRISSLLEAARNLPANLARIQIEGG